MAATWASGDTVVTLEVCGDLVTLTHVMTDAAGEPTIRRGSCRD